MLILLVGNEFQIPIRFFTDDPTSQTEVSAYKGMLSSFGIILWGSGAAISLFACFLLLKREGSEPVRRFLFASAVFTLILMLDDMFMIHERSLPGRGVDERITFSIYAIAFGVIVYTFRRTILKTEFVLLLLSIAFFFLSIIIDLQENRWHVHIDIHYILEDGTKTFGVISWFAYLVRTSFIAVKPRQHENGVA